MNDGGGSITVQVHAAIAEIPQSAWDACAGDVNPSVSHAFLSALEDSGSTTPRTGWTPQHLSIAARDGTILGVVPLYAKTHSYGEYVFDYGWADAYERAGGRYYPKLISAVPFTPVPGPRLLLHSRRAERDARSPDCRDGRALQSPADLVRACDVPRAARCRGPNRSRLSAARWPTISLDEQWIPRLRRLSCCFEFAQTQSCQKGKTRGPRRRTRNRCADRQRSKAQALGCILSLLFSNIRSEVGSLTASNSFSLLSNSRKSA